MTTGRPSVDDIRGLTHPTHYISAAVPLYKKRGRFAAAMTRDWVERMFVLSENAIYWFDQGSSIVPRTEAIGIQQGRLEVRHFVSMNQVERPATTSEDFERIGPRYQLEINTITAEQSIVVGSADKAVVDELLAMLSRAVGQVGASLAGAATGAPRESLPEESALAVSQKLLRLESTGLVALGYLYKARGGLLKPSGKDGWPLRFLVLTETHLHFFKRPVKRAETDDDGGIFGGFGSSLRSGEPIFGPERGRMPMANAQFSSHRAIEDGVEFTYITLTAALPGLSKDSLLTKGVSKIASIADRGADRFRTVLRTKNAALGAEWCAVLQSACGMERSNQFAHLNAAISQGDVSKASSIAAELAQVAAAVSGVKQQEGEGRRSSESVPFGMLGAASVARLPPPPPPPQAESGYDSETFAEMEEGNRSSVVTTPGATSTLELNLSVEEQLKAALERIAELEKELGKAHEMLRMRHVAPLSITLPVDGIGINSPAESPRDSMRGADDDLVSTPSRNADIASEAPPSSLAAGNGADSSVAVSADATSGTGTGNESAAASCAAQAAQTAQGDGTAPPTASPAAANDTAFAAAGTAAGVGAAAIAVCNHKESGGNGETAEHAEKVTSDVGHNLSSVADQDMNSVSDMATAAAATTASAESAAVAAPAPAPAPAAPPAVVAAPAPQTAEPPAIAPTPAPVLAPSAPGFPAAGSLTPGGWNATSDRARRWAASGDGKRFDVRIGPDYKRHGKKAPSVPHVYEVVAADVFRRPKILSHMASRVTLPPPPDDTPNDTGLPSRLVLNVVIPTDGPSITSFSADDSCYQIVLYFTASVESLRAWKAAGSPAVKLFQRWLAKSATESEVKERLKLLIKMDNLKELGLNSLAKYNGKPALITKSGSVFQGDDYVEIGINTFRFSFITKKGINSLMGRLRELRLHAALTIEGRDNAELPEQVFAACRVTNFDLPKIGTELSMP